MGATFSFADRIERQGQRLAKAKDDEVREELMKLLEFIKASGKSLRIGDDIQDWAYMEDHYPSDLWHIIQGRSRSKLSFRPDSPLNERRLLTFELAGCMEPGDY